MFSKNKLQMSMAVVRFQYYDACRMMNFYSLSSQTSDFHIFPPDFHIVQSPKLLHLCNVNKHKEYGS